MAELLWFRGCGMESDLYFPFADGLIGYDCIACGAGCCVDGILGVGEVERRLLSQKYPEINYFLREASSSGNFVFFEKFKPSCWFLRADKYCGIEKEFGRQYKPVLCRTHPVYFTPLYDEGIFLVWLGPVCHWKTSKDLSKATGIVSRDEINNLHQELKDNAYHETLPASRRVMNAVQKLSNIASLRAVINAEERIRDAWKDFDSYRQYLSWQLAYAKAFLDSRDPNVEVATSEYRGATLLIEELSQKIQSFLEVEEVRNSPEDERVLFLFTPILRLAWMGLIVEIPEALVESAVGSYTLYHWIPKTLLVMSIFSRIFTTVNPASRQSIDYNTLMQLYLHFNLRIFTLSCFGSYMDLGQIRMDMAKFTDGRKVEHFLNFVNPMDSAPIGSHIIEFCRDFTMDQKMIFIEDIGRCLLTIDFLPDFF